MNDLTVTVINDAVVYRFGDDYYARDTFPLFVAELASHFRTLIMCSPVIAVDRDAVGGYARLAPHADDGGFRIEDSRFPYTSFVEYVLHIWRAFRYTGIVRRSDVLVLRTNGFNIFPVALLCLMLRKPYGLYVVGDVREIARNKAGPGLRGLVIRTLGAGHAWLMGVIARFARFTILIGSYDHLVTHVDKGKVFHCLTSLISNEEICERSAQASTGSTTLLYVGRVSREKGLNYLIDALRILADDGYPVTLQVVGDGPALPGVREYAEQRGVASRCAFPGRVPYGAKLTGIYRGADLFVLPSTTEGIPKVLLEAMAHGAAVIATDVGGVPSIIQHLSNGILVRPRRPEEIAASVKRLVDDPATRDRLVKQGYAFVREHTKETQAEKVASIIRSRVGG